MGDEEEEGDQEASQDEDERADLTRRLLTARKISDKIDAVGCCD